MKVTVETAAPDKKITMKQLEKELLQVQNNLEGALKTVRNDSNPQVVRVKDKMEAKLQTIEALLTLIRRGSSADLRAL